MGWRDGYGKGDGMADVAVIVVIAGRERDCSAESDAEVELGLKCIQV